MIIKPMEPVLSKDLLTSPEYVYQVKWDGVRVLAHIDHGKVTLYTRHGNIRSTTYPEITQLLANQFPAENVYLDGEMISLRDGKPNFFQVVKRDRLKTASRIKAAIKRIPVSYVVFDVLYYGTNWLINEHFHIRNSILESLISPTEHLQLCPTTSDGESLFSYTKQHGWEGIVMKEKMGTYHLGEKHPTWRKVKHFQHIVAAILGVTLKSGSVYSLLLGVQESSIWKYIGRVSSGLTMEEKRILTHYSESLQVSAPVTAIPDFHEEEIRWFYPHINAYIRYLEWTPDGTLRNPVVERFSI